MKLKTSKRTQQTNLEGQVWICKNCLTLFMKCVSDFISWAENIYSKRKLTIMLVIIKR